MLLRHGRTADNHAGRIQGQLDTSLDEVGRAQAREAAKVLVVAEPAVLISSHLSRARDTARAVAEATGLQPHLDRRLAELHLGTWQGLTAAEARRSHPEEYSAWRDGRDVPRGGGETYREAGERAAACVREHLDAVPPGGTLMAVTHGGTARAALGVLLELPPETWGRLVALGNCCWSVLAEGDLGWRLERHNTSASTRVGDLSAGPADGAREAGLPGAGPL